jgi:hypothetical protein
MYILKNKTRSFIDDFDLKSLSLSFKTNKGFLGLYLENEAHFFFRLSFHVTETKLIHCFFFRFFCRSFFIQLLHNITMASKKRHMIRGGTDQEDASTLKLGEGIIITVQTSRSKRETIC